MSRSPYRIKAKRTRYRGTSYRSRTEAEWARWLRESGLDAEYERKTSGLYYWPDFTVDPSPQHTHALALEVKPHAWDGYPRIPKEWREKAVALARWGTVVIVVFGSPTEITRCAEFTGAGRRRVSEVVHDCVTTSDVRNAIRNVTGK